jgi:hypothetical protein
MRSFALFLAFILLSTAVIAGAENQPATALKETQREAHPPHSLTGGTR